MNMKTLLAATLSALTLAAVPAAGGTILYSENFDGEPAAPGNFNAGTSPEVNLIGAGNTLQSTGAVQSAIDTNSDTVTDAWLVQNGSTGRNGLRFGADPGYNWSSGTIGSDILTDGGFSVSVDWVVEAADFITIRLGQNASVNTQVNTTPGFGALLSDTGAQAFFNGTLTTNIGGGTWTVGETVNVEWVFEFDSWAAGSTVDFTTRVDGVEFFTDSFQWAVSDQAVIVLGSRGNAGGTAIIDNVVVSTVPEPGSLALLGLGGLLIARRRRQA